MNMQIRPFIEDDSSHLVDILQRNGQYGYPDVEGPLGTNHRA